MRKMINFISYNLVPRILSVKNRKPENSILTSEIVKQKTRSLKLDYFFEDMQTKLEGMNKGGDYESQIEAG